jgi:hypothetical protein
VTIRRQPIGLVAEHGERGFRAVGHVRVLVVEDEAALA